MNWYLIVLRNYVGFSGRARRTELWMFTLINVIISFILSAIDLGIGTYDDAANIGLLGSIYAVAVLLPSLAVLFRRLHDTNRTGWWVLIALIPIIGLIVLIIFSCIEGDRGPNTYGPDPKAVPAPA